MGTTEEEYAYGSGNGGRSCTGVSCLTIILATVIVLFVVIVPLATGGLISFEQIYGTWLASCGGTCLCLGFVGLIIGIVLIFIDDPEKAKMKERQRKLKAARANKK